MNQKCSIVKDLLPLYMDNLCSEETSFFIRNHLDECEDCCKDYKNAAIIIAPTEINETPMKPFHRIHRVIIKEAIIFVLCLLIVGTLLFIGYHTILRHTPYFYY